MSTLVLKLVLTPALIGTASLAGRRWGPSVSGWFVGLPLTSAPITFFLALSDGPAFASTVALGTMAGTASQAAFCVAYGRLAAGSTRARRFAWPGALAGGILAFALSTAALERLFLPLVLSVLVVVVALVVSLRLLPARVEPVTAASGPLPRWDLPARMIVATSFVVLLTGVAPALGPRLTGLLAPFPLYAATLTAFAHHLQGPPPAVGVLRGLLLGLFAFAGFFLTLATLLEQVGIGRAFAAASAVALALQGGSLWVLRREGASRGPR